jgi:hypothetical protein
VNFTRVAFQVLSNSLNSEKTMADKQATVYVVDLGVSTGDCHSGRIESDVGFQVFLVSGQSRVF